MITELMTLAVMGDPVAPVHPYLATPLQLPTYVLAAGLLLYQWIVGHRKFGLKDMLWLIAGAGLYWVLASMLNVRLATVLESGIFLLLVVLNLGIAFYLRRGTKARVIFLDMTVCFCISLFLAPGDSVVDYRTNAAMVLNMIILALILLGYKRGWERGLFDYEHQVSGANRAARSC